MLLMHVGSNHAPVSRCSTAGHSYVQCSFAALPHVRRFRIPSSYVSRSRDYVSVFQHANCKLMVVCLCLVYSQ